ncbi:MAG TPA: hypothetical protein VK627_07830 [Edaphobacter sp.]|jgi:hypothetical protein|nr:hypothetical protein [Edaphobacter sp.]
MQWVRSVLREVYGLFVDDGSFALAVLVWLGLAWLVMPRFGISPGWRGVVLFAGLASILVQSTWGYARRR